MTGPHRPHAASLEKEPPIRAGGVWGLGRGRNVKAPSQSDATRWDLRDLIAVCVDLKLVTSGVERLSSPVRKYRNLVHPGIELRSKLVFEAEEARIAPEGGPPGA
jgi:hypothetical protein